MTPSDKQLEYSRFVASRLKPLNTQEARINHAILGLITEVGELASSWKRYAIYDQPLDDINIREELGDFRFYIQALMNEKDYPVYNDLFRFHPDFTNFSIFNAVVAISEVIVEEGSDLKIPKNLTKIYGLIAVFLNLCNYFEVTEEEVMNENMLKLRLRYPDSYSDALALARIDKDGKQD